MKKKFKTGLPKKQKQPKKNGGIIVTSLVILVLILLGIYCWIPKTPKPALLDEQDIESYVRSKVSENVVCAGLEPVAVYHQRQGWEHKAFCCVGTVMMDKDHGPVLMTAEHVFRTDISGGQTVSFRPLRSSVDEPEYYLNKIIKTSHELKGADAVVATFASKPVSFAPFSTYVDGEIAKNFYGDVVIAKKKIVHLRSLVSGETVTPFGYERRGEGTNGQVFVIIDYHVRPGESGTGFIDDFGGLWIVHASPDPEIEKQMVDDYRDLMHKVVSAATTLSGPFGGKYD